MKKEEFLVKTNEMGIEPEEYRIFPGILVRQPYSYGTYLDEDEWVLYHIDERNSIHEFLRGDENFIFDNLYKFLFATLQLDDYLNNSITVDIVETTKSEGDNGMKIVDDYTEYHRIIKVKYDVGIISEKYPGLSICYRLIRKNEGHLKKITLTEVYDLGEYRKPWRMSFQEFKDKFNTEEEFLKSFTIFQLDEWKLLLDYKMYYLNIWGDCSKKNASCRIPNGITIDIKEILEIED